MNYLSEDWLEAASQAVTDLSAPGGPLHVGYEVLDPPDHARSYTLIMGPGGFAFVPGVGDDVVVRLRLSYDLAVAIATGRISAQRALLDGDIGLCGDITALLGWAEPLEAIDDRLAALRSRTTF